MAAALTMMAKCFNRRSVGYASEKRIRCRSSKGGRSDDTLTAVSHSLSNEYYRFTGRALKAPLNVEIRQAKLIHKTKPRFIQSLVTVCHSSENQTLERLFNKRNTSLLGNI